MRWTKEQLAEYEQRRKSSHPSICAVEPEQNQGVPLERSKEGKGTCSIGVETRYRITFTVFRVRPLDYDNHFVKPLQDCIVQEGLLPDDKWNVLEGCVKSRMCSCKETERTEITIERLP